jgi:glyoxylase-like metal-dependent hydrolase (beta-lactamase superfamily II)
MDVETLEKYTSPMFSVAPGVWGRKELFVNFYMIQDQTSGNWALVDAGLKWSASKIKTMANELFGAEKKPIAIILTHGHFDHVGALAKLVEEWQVPVYAHYLEIPYLTGKSPYPPADPSVGGGMMSTMSWAYPAGPIDVREHIRKLPDDNTIPGLPEWKYIHTPGHSPGHISLFRESDKVLIAGDAFVTTKAESAIYALSHMKALSGPPKYFTCNWASAKQSVMKLTALDPDIAATGHGKPMQGEELRTELHKLSNKFDQLAVPAEGRYVQEPAVTNEDGIVFLPKEPDKNTTLVKVLGISLAVITIGVLLYQQTRTKKKKQKDVKTKVADLFQLSYN